MTYKMKHNKSPKSRLIFILLAIVLIITAITGGVFAKYLTGFTSAYKQADTVEFYFFTDLAENTADNPYPVYDESIDLAVMNYDAFNTSQRNISYTVSVGGATHSTGELAGNAQSLDNISIPVTEDGNYTVTVSSTSPYSKTITLYFRVNSHYADGYYTVTTHTGWMELDIYTGEDNSDITVSYGSLQPDNTIEQTKDWLAGANASGAIEVEPYSHYKLIFFGNYDNSFELTQNGKTISKGA